MWKLPVASLRKQNPTTPYFGLTTVLSLGTPLGPLHETEQRSDLAPELLQILRAFPLFLTVWKHKNRFSTEVVLGCFSSHSDYSNTPLRHRGSIMSAPGLIRIGRNQLLNYTARGSLKSLPKMPGKSVVWQGNQGWERFSSSSGIYNANTYI